MEGLKEEKWKRKILKEFLRHKIISNELKEKIKKIAEEEGVSFSFLVNFLLEDALNSLE